MVLANHSSLNPDIFLHVVYTIHMPHFPSIHDHHLYVFNMLGCVLLYILMALKCCPSAFKASRLQRVKTLTRGGEMEPWDQLDKFTRCNPQNAFCYIKLISFDQTPPMPSLPSLSSVFQWRLLCLSMRKAERAIIQQ